MLKNGYGPIITIMAVIIFCTCIDPYEPKLKGYGSLLVVDGQLTDENISNTVRLTKTFQNRFDNPVKISGADVYIIDGNGLRTNFYPRGEGVYKTDSTVFRASAGEVYTLHIITEDGTEYSSDPCIMEPVPAIDSIYFEKHQEIMNNGSENVPGIMIYLDSKPGGNDFYRWEFTETWKFRVPFPKKYEYVNETIIIPLNNIKEYCWKTHKSDNILVRPAISGNKIKMLPVSFIGTQKSDRMLLQYNIQIRQYSISQKEFDFWSNLEKVNESGSDIFSSQPFPVSSNIHNPDNPSEMVLGYFKVSSVSQKRRDIVYQDVAMLGLPIYQSDCKKVQMSPAKVPPSGSMSKPPTWDEIYSTFCVTSDWQFVEPVYSGQILKELVFSRPECTDCGVTGNSVKPDFWKDRY